MSKFSNEAAVPNPSLNPFTALIGKWKTVGTHPYIPGTTFHGYSTFDWIEGGAFVMMRSEVDEEGIPSGIAIFGSDDETEGYFMLYFDERKVSRKYELSFEENRVKWWRNTPAFSQRYTWTFADNGNTIMGKGEMCREGNSWEADLEQTFTRIG